MGARPWGELSPAVQCEAGWRPVGLSMFQKEHWDVCSQARLTSLLVGLIQDVKRPGGPPGSGLPAEGSLRHPCHPGLGRVPGSLGSLVGRGGLFGSLPSMDRQAAALHPRPSGSVRLPAAGCIPTGALCSLALV